MGRLKSLVYVSSATRGVAEEDLEVILRDSRQCNARNGITGVLLYHDGNFFQYIEGEAAALDETFRRIQISHQHHGIIELLTEDLTERRFPGWYMGCLYPTQSEMLRLMDASCWRVVDEKTHADQFPPGIGLLRLFCESAACTPDARRRVTGEWAAHPA